MIILFKTSCGLNKNPAKTNNYHITLSIFQKHPWKEETSLQRSKSKIPLKRSETLNNAPLSKPPICILTVS